MGLFDSIAGNLLGSIMGGGNSGLGKLASDVMSGNHGDLSNSLSGLLGSVGGIQGLMQKANDAGLGGVVNSWVGTGPNQPVDASQVTQLLGNDKVKEIAEKFGIDVNQAAPLVASMLPVIIDKLTPHGEVPADAHTPENIGSVLTGLTQGGGLMNVLSGLIGGSKPA